MGGGAWKVAYADFVTAMMAFFLLLWILSMVPPDTKAGLAAYFSGERNFDSSSTSPISNNPFIQNTDKIDARDLKINEVEKSHYAIAQKIKQMLMADAVPQNSSGISADDVGVQLRVNSDVMFRPGSVDLLPEGTKVLEAVLKVGIFLTYMVAISKMKEIHRVFEYHGAEHKTIACYEAGDELTVENVRKYTRFHPRCGTSFLILVVIVSVFLYSVLPWGSIGLRVLFKLLLLPLVMGISYELLKWCGRSDNIATRIIRQPGIWVQHLTVFEPDDSMIEVAIAAVTPVLPEDPEDGRW